MDPQQTHTAGSGHRSRRALRRTLLGALIGVGVAVVLIGLAAVVLRLYYNDERLRQTAEIALADKLGTEVEIRSLDVSLAGGIELGPVRIGPMPGFAHDTLAFDRLAVHWSLGQLLLARVIFDEVALEGIDATVEETPELGRNTDALMRAFSTPQQEAPPPEEPFEPTQEPAEKPAKKKPVELPSLPVRIEIRRIFFGLARARLFRPQMQIELERAGAEGSFAGQGKALDLDLWVGLGEREQDGKPSWLRVRGENLPGEINVEQRLAVAIAAVGPGDLRVRVDHTSRIAVRGERDLPPVRTALQVALTADLLAQEVELEPCRFELGDGTRIELAARATKLFDDPSVSVATLRLQSLLDELAPAVAAFVPLTALTGRLTVDAEPFELDVAPGRTAQTEAAVVAKLEGAAARSPQARLDGVDVEVRIGSDGHRATLDMKADVGAALSGVMAARGLQATLAASTPLAPWVGGGPAGAVDATLTFKTARAAAPAGWAKGIDLNVNAAVPIALLQKKLTEETLGATATLRVGAADAGGASAGNVTLRLDATAWDLAGEAVDATLTARVANMVVPSGSERMQMEDNRLDLQFERRGQEFAFKKLDLALARTIPFHLHGAVGKALGPAPRFDNLEMRLGPIDFARAIALLPEKQRPASRIGGSAEATFRLHGSVPYRDLMRTAAPPELANIESQEDLSALMQRYLDYVDGWAARFFGAGLPFETKLALALHDMAYSDAKNEIDGVDLDFGFDIVRTGPVLRLEAAIDEVRRPLLASDLGASLSLVFERDGIGLTIEGVAGRVERSDLPKPLEGAGFALVADHRLGGDLRLERLLLEAPDRGVRMEASGVVSKPMRFAVTRGWEQAGLPGLDATLRWSAGIEAGDVAPLTIGGPRIGGSMKLSGSLRAEAGVISLVGLLNGDRFTAIFGDKAIEELSGGLPFDIRLAFGPHPETTVLKRNLAVGGGTLGIVTAQTDIRARAARPAYYSRLRPYRQRPGLTAARLRSGPHEVTDLQIEARIERGMLLADWIAMHVLGGDVSGDMALQLGRDASLRSDFALKVSNIDASYFSALNLQPGPQSELSADVQLGFLVAPRKRDLTLNMNVTKIGAKTFDRFMQLVDPEGKNESIQKTRRNLWLVDINSVAAWIRYENLNMDLDVTTLVRIPFTQIGFPNIDRELLRRYSLTDMLNEYAQPYIDDLVAPNLGWPHAG